MDSLLNDVDIEIVYLDDALRMKAENNMLNMLKKILKKIKQYGW